ncbi:MAG TPA: hypothetical protein VKY59_11100, partial [Spirillospora sp.]|nr:hypothetical protein [Spirillospora sp.]
GREQGDGIFLTANPEFASGYPVIHFQRPGMVTFSVVRPSSAPGIEPPVMFLRLFCAGGTDDVIPIQWEVHWRWVRAIGPVATDPPYNEDGSARSDDTGSASNETALLPIGTEFITEVIDMSVHRIGGDFHLSVSKPLPLRPAVSPADYLVIYLDLRTDALPVDLLMAELRWEVK